MQGTVITRRLATSRERDDMSDDEGIDITGMFDDDSFDDDFSSVNDIMSDVTDEPDGSTDATDDGTQGGDATAQEGSDVNDGDTHDDGEGELTMDDLTQASEEADRLSHDEAAARGELEDEDSQETKGEQQQRSKKRHKRRSKGRKKAETGNDDAADGNAYASATSQTLSLSDDTEEVHIPQWALSIASKRDASVAHAFMLSGNVRDYMVRRVSVRDGLIGMLDPRQDAFEVIATYDQASGLQFDLGERYTKVTADEYRKRFVRLMHEARKARAMGDDPSDDTIPQDPCELFEIIATIFDMDVSKGRPSKMMLFVDFVELLVPDGASLQLRDSDKRLAITMAELCRSYKADTGGSCVFFLTDAPTQVNATLRDTSSRVDQITIPQPSYDERRDFVDNVLDVPGNTLSDGRHVLHCEDGVTPEYLAVNTAGLACYQIEDIVLRSIADDTPVTVQSVKDRKNEIIKNDYHDVIEIMDPRYGFEGLGGMEIQKKFFKDEVIDPIHKGELESVPMGVLMAGPPGSGKSTSANSLVPTPSGWKRAGQIRVNDMIFDRNGSPTRVLGVFPQGQLEVYRVTLRDGRTVDCSLDHIWHVGYKSHGRIKWEDLTVQQMLDKGIIVPASKAHPNKKNTARFYVPMAGCVEYPHSKNQPLDPYVLGCFLGDGCKSAWHALELSSKDIDIVQEIANRIHATGFLQKKHSYSWYFYQVMPTDDTNGMKVQSTQYGWLDTLLTGTYAHDKHIPSEYLIADREQRLELLRGLMDTDGSIVTAGGRYHTTYVTVSKQLAHDVLSLIYSLGWSATVSENDRVGKPISGSKERYGKEYYYQHNLYEVHINIPNEDKHLLFKLPRKRDIAVQAASHHSPRHHERMAIASIEDMGYKEDMVCFYVDNQEHLFLVGQYVPTHNTQLAKAVAKESNMNCVALNMNNIFDKYVGNSEKNLDRALECAMAMEPTIIFIDEIDEALPKRHTGEFSSVNNHINKTMLTFLSDTTHRGKVIVLAATNYPEQVDPAMKRAGRFDKRIPIFAPTGYDRVRIIKISCHKATDVNTNGDNVPYQMSCLRSPDERMRNPFDIDGWLQAGGQPLPPNMYAGDVIPFSFRRQDRYGDMTECEINLPKVLYDIREKDVITLQEMYRALFAIMQLPERGHDNETNAVEDDSSYYGRFRDMLESHGTLFVADADTGNNAKTIRRVLRLLKYYDKIYRQFIDNTDHMTGAELDVVVQKAITLFRKWCKDNPDRHASMMSRGVLKSEKDIPWDVIYEACRKTTVSTASVKSMEDMALLDTSDLDFVPDAVYGRRGTQDITYKQRLEELRMKGEQLT